MIYAPNAIHDEEGSAFIGICCRKPTAPAITHPRSESSASEDELGSDDDEGDGKRRRNKRAKHRQQREEEERVARREIELLDADAQPQTGMSACTYWSAAVRQTDKYFLSFGLSTDSRACAIRWESLGRKIFDQ
jgi:hypothetical protein